MIQHDLWTRIIKYSQITNIKKILIQYRIHGSNISKTHSKIQKQNSTKIKINQLRNYLNINPTDEEILIHENIHKPNQYEINDFLKKEENWLTNLIEQNQKTKFYNEPEFSQVLSQRWLQICSINSNHNWKIWNKFWKSSLKRKLDLREWETWKLLIRFFFKCFIKKPQK